MQQPSLFPLPQPQVRASRSRQRRKPRPAISNVELGLDPVEVVVAGVSLTVVFRDGRPEFSGPDLDDLRVLAALGGTSPVLDWCDAVRSVRWISTAGRLRQVLAPKSGLPAEFGLPEGAALRSC